ncbi:hypothetical protein MMC12_003595 [Toensbergia leucococca]|nr:hypothetical protein [Toensbergia leucococca]
MSNQGYYNNGPQYPQQSYGGPPQQQGYPPQQGYGGYNQGPPVCPLLANQNLHRETKTTRMEIQAAESRSADVIVRDK